MHPTRPMRYSPRICLQCLTKLQKLPSHKQSASRTYYKAFSTSAVRYSSNNGNGRPFRLAVIGSGPAGFYTAYRVMQKIPSSRIDMYEYLPVPFGLVRYGVAPDHPEVKNVQEKFEEVASSDRFEFIGNIAVGKDISLTKLAPHYDAILFAHGAVEDRRLDLPGEDLNGVYSARAFVGWYNGLPQYAGLSLVLDGEEAVVIGQGNVALDVARVLLTDVGVLRKTDMAEHAIDALAKSRVKRVSVVGRRGPMQAAFTIKELRELMTLPTVSFDPIPESLMPSSTQTASLPRQHKRIAQLLAKGSANPATSSSKSWALRFLLSPKSFNATSSDSSSLASITFTQNQFKPDADAFSRTAKIQDNPGVQPIDFPTTLAFRSVGYKSVPLPTLADIGVPFDSQRGIIPNDVYGRVLADPEELGATGAPQPVAKHVPGIYCAGWVKRGPTGVIASTMEDAFATADAIASDFAAGAPFLSADEKGSVRAKDGWQGVSQDAKAKGLRTVSWEDWKRIDQMEKKKGKETGKEREKFTSIENMLKALDG